MRSYDASAYAVDFFSLLNKQLEWNEMLIELLWEENTRDETLKEFNQHLSIQSILFRVVQQRDC